MPGVIPPDVAQALPVPGQLAPGGPPPAGLSAGEKRAFEQISTFYTKGVGYAVENGDPAADAVRNSGFTSRSRRLDDQPRPYSYGEISRAFVDRQPVGNLTRDEVLDNVTLYWLTNSGVSSGRLYWDNKFGFFDAKNVTIPAGVSVFPGELYQTPRSWAEQAYPNLIYYNEVDKGGHFAAWEQPQLFSKEVRAAFRALR
jgi:pimeloyl-ACP methyl ester carboxylesterase